MVNYELSIVTSIGKAALLVDLYSLAFLLFLAGALTIYYLVGRLIGKGQWVVLLATSLVFYCTVGSWKTLWFVILTAAVTWFGPLVLARMDTTCSRERKAASDKHVRKQIKVRWARRKRLVLLACLLVCFGILAYLKYWNEILYQFGLASSATSLGLLLPLGISFYTFQSVSYVIDAYNGKFKPQKNFAKHLLFVSWFPQLIQGPIHRYEHLAPQLLSAHSWSDVELGRSLLTFVFGMMKKYALADLLVGPMAKMLTGTSSSTPGIQFVIAILMYSAQQYGDFSGGIDMMLGASSLFGVEMAPNFRRPYFSLSLADFWRRWHISLGQWMRDYVFYPFALTAAMKRFGRFATTHAGKHLGRTLPACLANILVFLVVGIWHGAELHFVVWGLYNGLVIAAADLLKPVFDAGASALHINRQRRSWRLFCIIRTFIVVNIGWYFDRIEDFGTSLLALKQTFFHLEPWRYREMLFNLQFTGNEKRQIILAAVAILVVCATSLWEERRGHDEPCSAMATLASGSLPYGIAAALLFVFLITLAGMFDVGGGFMYANY